MRPPEKPTPLEYDPIDVSNWETNKDFSDERNSVSKIYLSLLPFILFEYLVEVSFETAPSGLVFPLGFLLFWSFYYTFYRPDTLEGALKQSEWSLHLIPLLILGFSIWFVKLTLLELLRLLHLQALTEFFVKNKTISVPLRKQKAVPLKLNPDTRQRSSNLPKEVQRALIILGIGECRDWKVVQQRYRHLAKCYHPDLNKDITDVGNRFMKYDSAYQTLHRVKAKYFR